MQILQVETSLTCTSRLERMKFTTFRVLRDETGRQQVATDPVGAKPGDWVYTVSGTAARYAAGDYEVLTDLTIGGIIDHWPEPEQGGG